MARILYVLTLLILIGASALAQSGGAGRSFVLALPYTEPTFDPSSPVARLLLTSRIGGDVRLLFTSTGRIQTLTLPPGGSTEIVIDLAELRLPEQEGTFRNTVQIDASAPIGAHLLLDKWGGAESEGYAAIPDSLLGYEYIAVSTSYATRGSFITVIGIEDRTTVTITPAVATRSGMPRGVPFTVRLNRGDVYQLLTDRSVDVDLTGSRVVADRPVGVLSGAVCANFPIGAEHACNPLIEQLPDIDSWGKEFAVAPLFRQERAFLRIVPRCDNSQIGVNGNPYTVLSATPGEFAEFENAGITTITSSQPVLVVQWGSSTARSLQDLGTAFGDPSMSVVPPVAQWGDGFEAHLPALAPRYAGSNPVDWRYFLQLMLPSANEGGVLVDGLPPVWAERQSAAGFTVGVVEIGPGSHTVQGERTGTYLYGYSVTDAFALAPEVITIPWPLQLQTLVVNTCLDSVDTTLTVNYALPGIVELMVIDSVEFLGGVSGLLFDDLRAAPIALPTSGSGSFKLRVRLIRNGPAPHEGRIIFHGQGCSRRIFVMKVRFDDDRLDLDPDAGSVLDFGAFSDQTPYAERTVTLRNPGTVPMQVLAPTIAPGEFTLVSPSFPVTIPPGGSIAATLRFTPTAIGEYDGAISFLTGDCPDSVTLFLHGVRLEGGALSVGGLDPLYLLCTPKGPDTITVSFLNRTDAPVTIAEADIIGPAASEFLLLTSLLGLRLQPGDSGRAQVLYIPSALGVRIAALRLVSTDADTSFLPFDVRNDSLLLEPIEGALDFGVTDFCSPSPVLQLHLVNRGTVPVDGISGRLELDGVVLRDITSDAAHPGDTVTLDLAVGLTSAGSFNGGIRLTLEECMQEFFVPARGRRTGAAVGFSDEEIDFGLLNRCDSVAERVLTLENRGELDDAFDPVHLPAGGIFDVMLPASPVETPVGASVPVTVRFRPTGEGEFRDSIVLRSRACGTERTILLRGARDAGGFELSSPVIDFGVVPVPLSERGSLTITNRSTVPRTLSAASIPGSAAGLEVVAPLGDTIVPPGGSVELELLYTPPSAGDSLNVEALLLEILPCTDSLRVAVRGRSEERTIGLRWDQSEGMIGEEATLRLRLEQVNAPSTPDTLRLRAAVRFDASMLFPLESEGGSGVTARIVADEIRGNDRVVTIEVEGIFPESGVLAELRALAALGGAETTPLAFAGSDLRRLADSTPVRLHDTIDGIFRTLGICREGGVRLFRSQGFLRLSAARPNPIRDRGIIEFETLEYGPTRLVLYDARGNEILVPFDADVSPGSYAVMIDAAALPSGMYWLLLRTPTAVLRQDIQVVK